MNVCDRPVEQCPTCMRLRDLIYRYTVSNRDGSDAKHYMGLSCGHHFKRTDGDWVPTNFNRAARLASSDCM